MKRGVPIGLVCFGVATALSALTLLGIPEGDTRRSPPDLPAPESVVEAPPRTLPVSRGPVVASHSEFRPGTPLGDA